MNQTNSHSPHPENPSDSKPLSKEVEKLTSLMKAAYKLNNILDSHQLYEEFTRILRDKFRFDTVLLFIYDKKARQFDQVYPSNPDITPIRFKCQGTPFTELIMAGEPFSSCSDSGNLQSCQDFSNCELDRLKVSLWIPLNMSHQIIGMAGIVDQNNPFSIDSFDLENLKLFAIHAAICINTCQFHLKRQKEKEYLDKALHNLSLLYSIGRALTYINDLKSLLQYILRQAIKITKAEKGSIMLYNPDSDLLELRVVEGLSDQTFQDKILSNQIKCRTFKSGEGVAGRVFKTAKPIILNTVHQDDVFVDSDVSFVKSIACIPMVVYNDVIGVINLTNKKDENGFSDEDVDMLKAVADQAAVAINKAQLWEMAVTDSLTGLYIRRYFMVKLLNEIHRAERYSKQFSIVMGDLDKFKRINDTFGHTSGDQVLKAVGEYLQKDIRELDIIARFGGEEFVFLLPETDKESAYKLAERFRTRVENLKVGNLPQITISLGIASYPSDAVDIEGLIQKADIALYAAKQSGRNRVVQFSEEIEKKFIGTSENAFRSFNHKESTLLINTKSI